MSVEIAIPFKLSTGSIKVETSDAQRTRQHVMALLNVNKGERVIFRDYGSPFLSQVFENVDSNDVSDLQDLVTNAFTRWEPGVRIDNIEVTPTNALSGEAQVSVNYSSIDAPDSSIIGNTHTATFGVGGRLITQVTN